MIQSELNNTNKSNNTYNTNNEPNVKQTEFDNTEDRIKNTSTLEKINALSALFVISTLIGSYALVFGFPGLVALLILFYAAPLFAFVSLLIIMLCMISDINIKIN